jgi:hypothetical protein
MAQPAVQVHRRDERAELADRETEDDAEENGGHRESLPTCR